MHKFWEKQFCVFYIGGDDGRSTTGHSAHRNSRQETAAQPQIEEPPIIALTFSTSAFTTQSNQNATAGRQRHKHATCIRRTYIDAYNHGGNVPSNVYDDDLGKSH